jgi:hypothetical protein
VYRVRGYYFRAPSFPIVASLLRASTALEVDVFRSWAVEYLEEVWSDKLVNFDSHSLENTAKVIALARECGVPGVLKRAFYELVRKPGFDDSEEIGSGDEVCGEGDDGGDSEGTSDHKGEDNLLSLTDLRLLFTVREKLTQIWLSVTLTPPRSPTCRSSANPCDGSKKSRTTVWTNVVHRSKICETYLFDPIVGLDALSNAPWAEAGFCNVCIKGKQEVWKQEMRRLWAKLDEWLELE